MKLFIDCYFFKIKLCYFVEYSCKISFINIYSKSTKKWQSFKQFIFFKSVCKVAAATKIETKLHWLEQTIIFFAILKTKLGNIFSCNRCKTQCIKPSAFLKIPSYRKNRQSTLSILYVIFPISIMKAFFQYASCKWNLLFHFWNNNAHAFLYLQNIYFWVYRSKIRQLIFFKKYFKLVIN